MVRLCCGRAACTAEAADCSRLEAAPDTATRASRADWPQAVSGLSCSARSSSARTSAHHRMSAVIRATLSALKRRLAPPIRSTRAWIA